MPPHRRQRGSRPSSSLKASGVWGGRSIALEGIRSRATNWGGNRQILRPSPRREHTMKSVRKRLSYGNVVATLALFLALSGGAALAANKITSKQIGKGAVKNKNLAKNAVKNKNLAKNAVTSPKLAKGAVKNADLADGSVNFAKLATPTSVIASATGGPIAVDQDG